MGRFATIVLLLLPTASTSAGELRYRLLDAPWARHVDVHPEIVWEDEWTDTWQHNYERWKKELESEKDGRRLLVRQARLIASKIARYVRTD